MVLCGESIWASESGLTVFFVSRVLYVFFFFQAEDGIRDLTVTGVQTCALPILWAMGCIWSFREQALFAHTKGFDVPWLLPAVIDGLAIALACVAYAASLDGRPGPIARLRTAIAVTATAPRNANLASPRSAPPTTAVIAAGPPP